MKVRSVRIRNLRNLVNCEARDLPDLVVIGGPNGAGKSTFLDAICLWTRAIAGYGAREWYSQYELRRLLTPGASHADVTLEVQLEDNDVQCLRALGMANVPEIGSVHTGSIILDRQGNLRGGTSVEAVLTGQYRTHPILHTLLVPDTRSRYPGAPMFDYYGPHRLLPASEYRTFNQSNLTDEIRRDVRVAASTQLQQKNYDLKDYLFLQTLNWAQRLDKARRDNPEGVVRYKDLPDPFGDIRGLIEAVLPHLSFQEVRTSTSEPIQFLFRLGDREVELDTLSSGEREILSLFIGMHRTRLTGSLLLIDEPELHLHQAIETRLLQNVRERVIREGGNQVFLATHSAAILAGTPGNSLFRLLPPSPMRANQFSSICGTHELLKFLARDMGAFLASDVVVFLEGADPVTGLDSIVLNKLLPNLRGRASFVSVGGSQVIESIGRMIEAAGTGGLPWTIAAIRDRDRLSNDEVARLESNRLAVWPYCNLENALINTETWVATLSDMGRNVDPKKVDTAFKQAGDTLRAEEIDLRIESYVQANLAVRDFRDSHDYSRKQKITRLVAMAEKVTNELPDKLREVEDQVNRELQTGAYKASFRGKQLIRATRNILDISTPDDEFVPLLATTMERIGRVPEAIPNTVRRILPELFPHA